MRHGQAPATVGAAALSVLKLWVMHRAPMPPSFPPPTHPPMPQVFESMNKALKLSCTKGLPVRVVRSFKVRGLPAARLGPRCRKQ